MAHFSIVGTVFARLSHTSPTNGATFVSRDCGGSHLPSPTGSHTAAHRAKHGAFWMGALSLPSERFARFGNTAWPGVRTAYFAAFGPWPGALPKNAESLRDSDALMRVAVSRRRGPAGTRSPAAIPRFAPMGPTVFSVTATGRRETYLLFHTLVCSMRLATRCRSFALSTASICR